MSIECATLQITAFRRDSLRDDCDDESSTASLGVVEVQVQASFPLTLRSSATQICFRLLPVPQTQQNEVRNSVNYTGNQYEWHALEQR